jgi:hypothetical protein
MTSSPAQEGRSDSATGTEAVAGFLLVFIVLLLVAVGVGFDLKKVDSLGSFGDFVGGFLNPFIALAALLFIAKTYQLQQAELTSTRTALLRQNELSVFFGLLDLRGKIVEDLKGEVRRDGRTIEGRALVSFVAEHLHKQLVLYEASGAFKPTDLVEGYLEKIGAPAELQNRLSAEAVCVFHYWYTGSTPSGERLLDGVADNPLSAPLEVVLGHLFRSTYQVLKFARDAKGLDDKTRVDLANYLRAQMSESEFALFALTALTKIGEKSRAASVAFDLFENRLNVFSLWAVSIKDLLTPTLEKNCSFARSMKYPVFVQTLAPRP